MAQLQGFVTVSQSPEVQIYYSVDGPLDGSRPYILLSNSLAATTHLWDIFVAEFSSNYTIIRYDARFHGQSPLSSSPNFDYAAGHSLNDLADDILKLLDHLHLPKVTLAIGLSIGAGALLIAGAKAPERFGHVLVVATKARPPRGVDEAFDRRLAYGLEHGDFALGQQSVRRWFSEAWIAENPEKAAAVEKVVGSQNMDGFRATAVALRKFDLVPVAEEVASRGDGQQFTFVAGEFDADLPQDAKLLGEKAGSKVVIVSGSGHIVNVQVEDKFHALVRETLKTVEGA